MILFACLLVGGALAGEPVVPTDGPDDAESVATTDAAQPPAVPEVPPPSDGEVIAHLARMGAPEAAFALALREAWRAPEAERLQAQIAATRWLFDHQRFDLAARHLAALPPTDAGELVRAHVLYRAGRFEEAAHVADGLELPEAGYLQGWAALQTEDLAAAGAAFRAVGADPVFGPRAQALVAELEGGLRVPHRAPALAGLMSTIVPGSGQLYVGRTGEAISALVFNGLLAAATTHLLLQREWFGGAVVGLVGISFWGGNTMSAVNGARRFNETRWAETVGALPGPPAFSFDP